MPAPSPRIPSPTDLARIRPAPATPQPRPSQPRPSQPRPSQPSRGRQLAAAEKERARQALLALITDPTTDFAGLDADDFFAALRYACQGVKVTDLGSGPVPATLIAEAGRRIVDGAATPRELHQVLCVAEAGSGWGEVRNTAMAVVGQRPHLAVEVANLEVQRLGLPPIRVTESTSERGFAARASLDRGGATVEGSPCFDTSKKRASQQAVASLLALLVGIPLPEAPARDGSAPTPVRPPAPEIPATPGMGTADLQEWLDHVIGQPEPDPDLADQLTARRLTIRSMYLLLFEAQPRGWARHRAEAWSALVAAPSQAPGVLSMYTQAQSWPPAAYLEFGDRTAVGYVSTPDGPVVSEPAAAAGIRATRASAALGLVRELAPAVECGEDTAPEAPAGGRNPVGFLNERAQIGAIAEVTYVHEATGPAHQPVFACTASCVHAGDRLISTAEATSKNAAKAAAAAELLEQVLSAERAYLARIARARREQARSRDGIFTRLLRAGCPVDFTGWGFRLGDIPEPLMGCELPILPALPVLAALDYPIHPSARTWASATRAALAAVAARDVYPAVDADGRDCWRLAVPGPLEHAIVEFFDTVAETLLRPPGARLVVGDLPYAGRPRRLAPDAADWADRAAEAAEGTTTAALVIRLSPPENDDLPLRAQLRTASPGLLSHAEERLIRRAARTWQPLERIRRDGTLDGAEAAELLGPVAEQLAGLGITVEWPADLVTASGLGTQIVAISQASSDSGRFSPTGVVDLTWQLVLDGEPLTAEETAAAAEAVAGVIRIRDRWVVVDAETRRRACDRHAGQLTGAQALGASLTGQMTVGGREVACAATGRLADLIATLRGAGASPHDSFARSDSTCESGSFAPPEGLHATLRGYQRIGVRWLERMTAAGFGALLADDMGLGKTITVIAYRLVRESTGPSLVVCPASLVANWEREFERFAPQITVRRYHAAGRSLDGLAHGEVVVTTYGTLLRDAPALAGVSWDLVVADEAQQVKNHRSQAARALRLLRPAARVAVTGTPVENSLSELWAILDWTNPGLFGPLSVFRDRFGQLIAPFVLRRRKTDPEVAPELPDKVINDRYVELTREQTALYQAATTQALDRIAASDGLARRGQVLRLMQSLRQICNSPAHYLRESPDGWDAPAQAARSGKLGVLEELMEAIVLADDAALIFTGYVSMGHLIRAHLAACGIRAEFLHGGTPVAARHQMVDRFQAGEGDALILSVRAAGTGLNLTRAGHVIHFDRPWNPAVEDQATDRAHRIGQHRLVEVHHLIVEGTIEDRIAGLLASKRELTEAVFSHQQLALAELSDSELSALVSLGADPITGGIA
ncbi:MAG: hypothetical protein JXA67_07735 [Micromonosporaceae bacterium]|nr:hypothetical protein [Micromonosporaceae bacterium]